MTIAEAIGAILAFMFIYSRLQAISVTLDHIDLNLARRELRERALFGEANPAGEETRGAP